jgi:hypothetical protein
MTKSVMTKLLIKKASYKGVDIFNGNASKKIQDILSIQQLRQTSA